MPGKKKQEEQAQAKKPNKGVSTGAIVGFVVLGLICVPYIYYALAINLYGQKNKPTDYNLPGLKELWMTVVAALACTVVRRIVKALTYPTFYRISKEQNDEEVRTKYALKACDKTYRTTWFVIAVYWGWSVLKDTPYLPWYLGGMAGGDFRNINLKTIYDEYPPGLISYSFYTFGYHLQDFIEHAFFSERMNDYNEMLLHHIAAVSLYFAYTMGNMHPLGCVVAFLHDIADIPGSLCKLLNATHFQHSSAVVFVMCMITWFYTRICVLPPMIYFIFQQRYLGELDQFTPYLKLNGIFLSIMCALHFYWFSLFFKILGRYVFKGEADDLQNKVQKKKD